MVWSHRQSTTENVTRPGNFIFDQFWPRSWRGSNGSLKGEQRLCSNINSKLIAAGSFVISGFVQFAIQEKLTPIPDYNSENTLMVTNGVSRDIKVSSSYWVGNKLPGDDYENNLLVTQAGFQFVRFWLAETVNKSASNCNRLKYCSETECSFDVNTTYTRTPTFDWFNEYNEHGNYELKIIDSKLGFTI